MKIQLVFAAFLVCSLTGELFGQVVEDSNDVLLDNKDAVPARRAYTLPSGCVNDPDNQNIIYCRKPKPGTSSKFSALNSRTPNRKVQYQQYRQDNYIHIPAYNVPVGPSGYRYPRRGLKLFQSNKNGRFGSYGIDPRCLNQVVQYPSIDGQYFEQIPRNSKRERNYLHYFLRDNRGRQVLRRMLDTADAEEEEGDMEDVQE